MRNFPLAIRIAEIEREIVMRRQVYNGQAARGKMKMKDALNKIEIMEDVRDTLVWLQKYEDEFKALIAAKEAA